MRPVKRFLQNDTVRRVLCRLGAAYIRLVYRTSRWRVVNGEVPARFWETGAPFIVCFWHGRLLMMPEAWDYSHPFFMLSSSHRDGLISSNTVKHFGIQTIYGSTKKGGAEALRALVKVLKGGGTVGFTPDGPRGPRGRVSTGVVVTARLSGAPLVPLAFSAERRRVLGTWDRFFIAWPFNRGVFVWGDPIPVPRDADLEAVRLSLEEGLQATTDEADRLCGVEPVPPAPPPEKTPETTDQGEGAA